MPALKLGGWPLFFAKSHLDLHNIRGSVERTVKLSDNIIGVGPVGIGLDGILAWFGGAGSLYSLGAGGVLLFDGVRARAAPMVLIQMTAVLLIDALLPLGPPGLGAVADTLFTGQKWAGGMLIKHMDDTIYFEGSRKEAQGTAEYRDLLERIRSGKEKRRVVFLG